MSTSSTYPRRSRLRAVPSPNSSALESQFWDRVADGYASKSIVNEAAYRHKLSVTQSYLSEHSSVLEVGCGTGSTALEHAQRVRQITATDVSGRMIEIAESKAERANATNLTFAQCTASDALDCMVDLDVVLALNLLHLLSDWRSVVQKSFRALKPGGVFVTSTLCLAEQHSWLIYVAPLGRRLGLMPKLVAFSREELKSALLLDGFNIEYEWQADKRNGLFLIARRPG